MADRWKIKFNKPFLTGKETEYIVNAVNSGKISGNGIFTKKCQAFLEQKFDLKKTLLTTSATDALEMAAILINTSEDDEIIIPSYTFVSTANAFVLRGAKIVFADSSWSTPHIDVEKIESLITKRTKAIVPVHYGGVACDMDPIIQLAKKYDLFVIEDAAPAINSFYKDRALGGIGDFGVFSFHETKNIIAGEGGLLIVNDEKFANRAEVIWEKGTNRTAFFRGQVDKYNWVDIGSSFLPSDVTAAFLYAQLEQMDRIQDKRNFIWNLYYKRLQHLEKNGKIILPVIPAYATNNAHLFYILCKSQEERSQLIEFFKKHGILLVFHYLSLHRSPYFEGKHDGRELENSDRYSDCLVRLPFFYDLREDEVHQICNLMEEFYK